MSLPAIAPAPRSITYKYLDERLHEVWITQVPKNDDQALNYFVFVDTHWPGRARYLQRQTGFGSNDWVLIAWEYVDGEVVSLV